MAPIPPPDTLARSTRKALVAWTPKPIPVPQLAPDVLSLPAIERAAEILRYRLLSLEYALSPNGSLRAWFKLCLKIALVIGIPVLLIGPILMLVLTGIVDITEAIASICLNLLKAFLAIAAIVVVIAALVAARRR